MGFIVDPKQIELHVNFKIVIYNRHDERRNTDNEIVE